jgi:hypothetical protein
LRTARSAGLAAITSARAAGVQLSMTPAGRVCMRGFPHVPAEVVDAITQHRDEVARLLAPDVSCRPHPVLPDLEAVLDLAESLAQDVPGWNREQARADALAHPLPPRAWGPGPGLGVADAGHRSQGGDVQSWQAGEDERQREMSSYNNDLRGILSRNDRRERDSQPEFRGDCAINGTQFWIDAWMQERKDGSGHKFFSLKFRAKDMQHADPEPRPSQAASDDLDSPPF